MTDLGLIPLSALQKEMRDFASFPLKIGEENPL